MNSSISQCLQPTPRNGFHVESSPQEMEDAQDIAARVPRNSRHDSLHQYLKLPTSTSFYLFQNYTLYSPLLWQRQLHLSSANTNFTTDISKFHGQSNEIQIWQFSRSNHRAMLYIIINSGLLHFTGIKEWTPKAKTNRSRYSIIAHFVKNVHTRMHWGVWGTCGQNFSEYFDDGRNFHSWSVPYLVRNIFLDRIEFLKIFKMSTYQLRDSTLVALAAAILIRTVQEWNIQRRSLKPIRRSQGQVRYHHYCRHPLICLIR